MSLFNCNLDDLDVVVVHYLQVRPTVAMLNALFKVYPEIGITLVDNSGGVCVATEQVLPHLGDKASQIRVLVNPATEHGWRGPLSHGAGLDLAFAHCTKPYLLSLETDTFILERGPLEFALSLLQNDGYDWAGLGQKPINGLFASFSPSFAIFKTALVRDHGLSFKVHTLNQSEIDPEHPLLQHHRQAASRVRLGLPLLYPDGKAPDTYRLHKDETEQRELGHLQYFDTGEWVHHRLLELGYRGQLFIAPPGVCHSWGSRDENIFFLNLLERLPELEINRLLPPELQLKTHPGELPSACLALVTPDGSGPAPHWVVASAESPVRLSVEDSSVLCMEADLPFDGKVYVGLSDKPFDQPAPQALGAAIVGSVCYRLCVGFELSGNLRVDMWVIEYGAGQRLQHQIHKLNSAKAVANVDFVSHPSADQFRVLFRLVSQGTLKVSRLELMDHYRPKPSATVDSRPSGYKPKKHACIVVCADALRADYEDLVATYHAGSEIGALQSLKSMAQAPDAAYTAATWTLPSHMSMFTGLYPHQHGYGVDFRVGQGYPLPQHLAYLPQYLVGRGIPCYGFHNGGVMEPSRGLGYGWTRYSGSHPGDVDGPVHSFMKALPELGDTFFAFIHTYAVHNYYSESATPLCLDLLSPFERKHLNTLLARWGNLRWLMAENLRAGQVVDALTTEIVRKLYVGAILRFDRLLNQLVQRLQATGSFDQCTLLLLSDHGEALGEVHEGVQHWSHMTINVHEENIRVPFLFKPGHGVQQVDVPKTLSLVDLPNIVTSCFGLPSAFPRRRMNEVFVTGATHQFGKEWETTIPLEQRIYRSALLKGGRKHHLLGDAFYLEKTCNVTSQPFQDERLFGNFEADITPLDIERLTRPIPMDRLDFSTPIAPEFLEHLKGLGYVD